MTKYKFEQASLIMQQIEHINTILKELGEKKFDCEPPIRSASLSLVGFNGISIHLNEGEVVLFISALKSKREALYKEFQEL